jgi:hypothetical protein
VPLAQHQAFDVNKDSVNLFIDDLNFFTGHR